jgi:hypothetical protein
MALRSAMTVLVITPTSPSQGPGVPAQVTRSGIQLEGEGENSITRVVLEVAYLLKSGTFVAATPANSDKDEKRDPNQRSGGRDSGG